MERMISEKCEKNVRTIAGKVGVSEETAMNMILMTAALMDLYPDDEGIVSIVLRDIGLEPEPA